MFSLAVLALLAVSSVQALRTTTNSKVAFIRVINVIDTDQLNADVNLPRAADFPETDEIPPSSVPREISGFQETIDVDPTLRDFATDPLTTSDIPNQTVELHKILADDDDDFNTERTEVLISAAPLRDGSAPSRFTAIDLAVVDDNADNTDGNVQTAQQLSVRLDVSDGAVREIQIATAAIRENSLTTVTCFATAGADRLQTETVCQAAGQTCQERLTRFDRRSDIGTITYNCQVETEDLDNDHDCDVDTFFSRRVDQITCPASLLRGSVDKIDEEKSLEAEIDGADADETAGFFNVLPVLNIANGQFQNADRFTMKLQNTINWLLTFATVEVPVFGANLATAGARFHTFDWFANIGSNTVQNKINFNAFTTGFVKFIHAAHFASDPQTADRTTQLIFVLRDGNLIYHIGNALSVNNQQPTGPATFAEVATGTYTVQAYASTPDFSEYDLVRGNARALATATVTVTSGSHTVVAARSSGNNGETFDASVQLNTFVLDQSPRRDEENINIVNLIKGGAQMEIGVREASQCILGDKTLTIPATGGGVLATSDFELEQSFGGADAELFETGADCASASPLGIDLDQILDANTANGPKCAVTWTFLTGRRVPVTVSACNQNDQCESLGQFINDIDGDVDDDDVTITVEGFARNEIDSISVFVPRICDCGAKRADADPCPGDKNICFSDEFADIDLSLAVVRADVAATQLLVAGVDKDVNKGFKDIESEIDDAKSDLEGDLEDIESDVDAIRSAQED